MMKTCVDCKQFALFILSYGADCYCLFGFWEQDGLFDETDFRKAIRAAETCPDYEGVEDEKLCG